MKIGRLSLAIPIVGLIMIGFGDPVNAFHDGGVGDCSGCHSMHSPTSPVFLLAASNPSETCLNCHQGTGSFRVSSTYVPNVGPSDFTPGGDFAWVKQTYTWTAFGSTQQSLGERHGHNILALLYGYNQDSHINAPGSNPPYPSSKLSCTSCHEPHGKYRRFPDGHIATTGAPIIDVGSYGDVTPSAGQAVGVYRLLGGIGYQPQFYGIVPMFSSDPPAAVVPRSYNRSEAASDTRVAYGQGMSEWCANCHALYLTATPSEKHPTGNGVHLGTLATNYNEYLMSGILTGSQSTAFTSLVPFEVGSNDYAALATIVSTTPTNGPETTANVACVTCHRAHASGWDFASRWNNETEFLIYNGAYPGTDIGSPVQYSQGRTQAEIKAAYHMKPETRFASSLTGSASYRQRSLCNKCHVND